MGAYLSAPKTNKESLDGGNLELDPSRYGLSCMQGWRKNMEDSHICYSNLKLNEIEEDVSIYGVFDGHGGPNVSKWISYNFRRIFLRCIKEASEELTKKNLNKSKNYKLKLIKLTLEKTFLKLDEEMLLTENQEKLKKYSVPTQENEEESDTRENYLYSILNDIISKNISIKAVEKDGKRCLQVVYNKDGNPVEEDNAESSTTLANEENDKSADLLSSTDSIVKEENNDEDEDGDETREKETAKEDERANKNAVKKESCKDGGSTQDGKNKTLKKDDENSEGLTASDGEENGAIKCEVGKGEKDEKTEDDDEKNSGSTEERTDAEEKNKEGNVAEGTCEMETNKAVSNASGSENQDKVKDDDDKEQGDEHADNGETAETNAKRLKKGMNNEYSSSEKESNKEEDLSDGGTGSTCEPVLKAELTYDNLKCMEEAAAKEAKNNGSNGNLPGFDENALRLYEKGSSNSEEGFSYDEAVTNVIDNNISSNNDASNEADDCNGLYSSDELRLFENYYSNDYEDNIAYSCGSTAIVAVILKGYLIVANAGDSRAIVCFNGNSLGMSTDHKPHLQEEEARIKKAGGYISNGRVDGNLNLTRAIGDLHYKRDPFLPQKDQKISAFPEVTCVTLTPEDEFLFLACDGIWDCKDGQDVVGFVKTRLEKFEEPTSDEIVIDSTDNTNENATTTITTNENIVNSIGNDEKDKSKEFEKNEGSKEKKNAGGVGDLPIGKKKHNKMGAKGTNSNDEGVENDSEKKTTKEEGSISKDANEEDAEEEDDEEEEEEEDEEDEDDDEDEENVSPLRTHDGLEMDKYDEDDTKFDSAPVIVRKKFEKFSKLSQICEELCDDCLSNNYKENDGIGCDNMTCLIVQYNPVYKIHTEKKFLNIDDIE
ncbi:protein phosphatase [Plasmodium inui San Antonio 1]|uniref:protein-serine/threonine phosphatase n=1 Tax=Plasmodium inui San Antonio 1 TaxID=1237626 RepID=W7A621_9APIC|nr:protein phosphatase [Plasmodium inui San Antonio 1]EUD67235.1 protein phosphatase [Plasmodium inui San Antonio 1]